MTALAVRQDVAASGSSLMAEDELLLNQCERGEFDSLVRFYEWDIPTISLGFHQDAEQLDFSRMNVAHVPWVRRPTGGAAVLHSEELTYAIVMANGAGPRDAARVQELVSKAIA